MTDIYLPKGLPAQVLTRLQKRKLSYSAHPVKLTNVGTCRFFPAVFLQGRRPYLIVETDEATCTITPGWYDVPDQGYVTWVADFKLVVVSGWSPAKTRCFIYEAIEGEPPEGALQPEPGQLIH